MASDVPRSPYLPVPFPDGNALDIRDLQDEADSREREMERIDREREQGASWVFPELREFA